jgi:hypothetical protein
MKVRFRESSVRRNGTRRTTGETIQVIRKTIQVIRKTIQVIRKTSQVIGKTSRVIEKGLRVRLGALNFTSPAIGREIVLELRPDFPSFS